MNSIARYIEEEDDDRRIKARFQAPCLDITVRRMGLLGLTKGPIKANCVDINRYGMAVVSPLPLAEGTRILVDFKGKYISQSGVKARIMSVQPYQAGYRLGIQFSYCMDRHLYSRTIDNALSRIEALYRDYRARRHSSSSS
ncbi:PilZ domain-containing protein [Marinobacteraceae bacterium S3BR75-40.1]